MKKYKYIALVIISVIPGITWARACFTEDDAHVLAESFNGTFTYASEALNTFKKVSSYGCLDSEGMRDICVSGLAKERRNGFNCKGFWQDLMSKRSGFEARNADGMCGYILSPDSFPPSSSGNVAEEEYHDTEDVSCVGLAPGTWRVNYNGKQYTGSALCAWEEGKYGRKGLPNVWKASGTKTEVSYTDPEYEGVITGNRYREYCWCKDSNAPQSDWRYLGRLTDEEYTHDAWTGMFHTPDEVCGALCAYSCAEAIFEKEEFRLAVLWQYKGKVITPKTGSVTAKGLDFDGVCTVKTKEHGEWYQDADLCVGMQKGEWSVDFYGNKSSGSTFCAGNKCVCGGSDHLWFNSGEQCERNCASRCAKEMLESDEHYANEDRKKELCEVGFGVIADKNVKYDEDRELCVLKIKKKVKKWQLSQMVENFGHGCKLQPVRANDPIAPYASADVWCPDIGFNMLIDMDNYQEE